MHYHWTDAFIFQASQLANRTSNTDALKFTFTGENPTQLKAAGSRLAALESKYSSIRGKFVTALLAGYVAVHVLVPGVSASQEPGQRMLPVQALEAQDVSNPAVQIYLATAIAQQEKNSPISSQLTKGFEVATGQPADPKELQEVIWSGARLSLMQKYAIKPVLVKIDQYIQILKTQIRQFAQAA